MRASALPCIIFRADTDARVMGDFQRPFPVAQMPKVTCALVAADIFGSREGLTGADNNYQPRCGMAGKQFSETG